MKNHSLPNKAIIIVGRISSGKSTLAKQVSNSLDAPIASFGGYLKEYCLSKGIPINRNSLQEIGDKFVKEDPELFLLNVLQYSSTGELIIIEGVRHKIIFELVNEICKQTLSIFLEVSNKVRYERFLNRMRESDINIESEKEFMRMDKHPVELEIDNLKAKCDLCIGEFNDSVNHQILKAMGNQQ